MTKPRIASNRAWRRASWALILAALASTAASANDRAAANLQQMEAERILAQVDRLRMPIEEGRLRSTVSLVAGEAKAPPIAFDVQFIPNGARRIETLDGTRAGQRVLLRDDGYWLFMPGTSKPVRLTQIQRMLGQASFGDVSRIRFARDYRVETARREADGVATFALRALDDANAYRSLKLVVDADDNPLQAVFLYPSGKVFKSVTFSKPELRDGQLMIHDMRFVDPTDASRYSVVHYSNLVAASLPSAYFEPAQLSEAH